MRELEALINKHKKYAYPAISVIFSIFLIIIVIMPQLSSIPDLLNSIRTQRTEVENLKATLSVLSSQNDTVLDQNFSTATTALPAEKQVSLIFDTLSSAAAESGTILEEFNLSVGGLYGRAAKVPEGVTSAPTVEVSARIGGDAEDVIEFMKILQKKSPLSEIKKLTMSGNDSQINVGFFYKPVDTIMLGKQIKVNALSQSDLNLLGQLSSEE